MKINIDFSKELVQDSLQSLVSYKYPFTNQQQIQNYINNLSSVNLSKKYSDYSVSTAITSLNLLSSKENNILAVSLFTNQAKIYYLSKNPPYLNSNQIVTLIGTKQFGQINDIVINPFFNEMEEQTGKILTACSDGCVRLFTADFCNSKQNYLTFEQIHEQNINGIKYLKDVSKFVTIGDDCKIIITDIQTKQNILKLNKHQQFLTALAVHPHGSLLYIGEQSGYGAVWDMRIGRTICDFNNDFKQLNFINDQDNIQLKYNKKHNGSIRVANFSQEGWMISTGGMDGIVKVWDLRRQDLAMNLPLSSKSIEAVNFTKYTGVIWCASSNGKFKVLDWFNNKILFEQDLGKGKLTGCVFEENDNPIICAGFKDRKINIYDSICNQQKNK